MKNKLLNTLLAASLTFSIAQAGSNNLIAGYLDATATGSALKINLNDAVTDGYNMVIFGFGKITGTSVEFYNNSVQDVVKTQIQTAKQLKMQTLVSFGGQVNTFNPGELSAQQLQKLADNMVEFVHNNNFDGIDFDIEVHVDPTMLKDLIFNIKQLDQNIIVAAAPQINNGRLVTTGENEDYKDTIDAGLFNYLFLQEYNTGPQNEISYISSSYPGIKSQVPAQTKLVIGQPSAAVAAGIASIYHPTAHETLDTQEVTAKMLPELKKIHQDEQYAGVMGWSLNVDYSAADYADPDHISGTYAYGLKECVLNAQCDTPPTPKTPVANYNLQTTNTDDSVQALGIIIMIKDSTGNTFTSDYLGPNANKTYNKSSNPSASPIEGKTKLTVTWSTWEGGPSGTCDGSFDLTHNMNVMVNPTYQSCEFKQLA